MHIEVKVIPELSSDILIKSSITKKAIELLNKQIKHVNDMNDDVKGKDLKPSQLIDYYMDKDLYLDAIIHSIKRISDPCFMIGVYDKQRQHVGDYLDDLFSIVTCEIEGCEDFINMINKTDMED